MGLETIDKPFNKTFKIVIWILSSIATVVVVTWSIIVVLKSEMEKTVKTSVQLAISELVYEMRDFKEVKKQVEDHEKTISLLSYRVDQVEQSERRTFSPSYISKDAQKPEEVEYEDLKKKNKKK